MASKSGDLPRQPLGAVDTNATISAPVESGAKKAASNKRKADEVREEIDIDDDRCQMVDISCDRVRTKIRNFINSREMKVTEFQKAIGTNSKSYGAFMGQSGPYKGSGSSVYGNAFAFFKHRELNGIKAPKKKVKKEDEVKQNDVSGIKLDGEEDDEVEVYDSCDEMRKKIRAYLATPSVTQAGFLREIAKTFGPEKKIQSKSLNEFLGKKGPMAGNTSSVYYASYVFFEKLRIRDGKPKSKHRLEMEKVWDGSEMFGSGKAGVDVKTLMSNQTYICHVDGPKPYMDEYGRVRC